MEKDIGVLVGATNNEIFEEQAKHWPGIEIFRTYAWKCECYSPNCFRECVQGTSRKFGNVSDFAEYLEYITCMEIKSSDDLQKATNDFEPKRLRTMN